MAKRDWYRLDNSAKIMPCTTTNLNTNVFRLTCTLFDDVDKKALQEALDKTLIEFPMYLCTMKDGLFWHYLEKIDYKPLVKEEKSHVCKKIDKDILCQISEIKYDPNEIDKDRYYLYMNDGNSVYLTVNKFEKINKYNSILENVGKQNGTLYLDYGDYFEVK